MRTDSHFVERDRMGRFVAFLARIVQDGWATEGRGIAIDSQTAVLIDGSGSGSVVGNDTAYFMQTPGPPEVCQPKTPLTFHGLSVYRVDANGMFDFPTWTGSNGTSYEISSDAGVLTTTQPGGGVY